MPSIALGICGGVRWFRVRFDSLLISLNQKNEITLVFFFSSNQKTKKEKTKCKKTVQLFLLLRIPSLYILERMIRLWTVFINIRNVNTIHYSCKFCTAECKFPFIFNILRDMLIFPLA